jgi:hypothetical protein
MKPTPLPSLRIAAAALVFLLPAGAANAVEWRADAGAGVLTTDNLFRTASGQTKADILDTKAGFMVRESTRTIDLDADGSITFRRYNVDGVGDDKLPNLRGRLQWTLSPDRLAWVVTDTLGQLAINPTDALVPPDRQNLNILSTGPDARLAVGNASWVTASGRYSKVNYENSPFDNAKVGGRVGYEHELDSGRFVSVNALDTHTAYSDQGTDFDIQTLFAGYTSNGAHAAIDANIGVERLKQGDLSKNGFFADITLDRKLTRRSQIFLNLTHRLGDSANLFSRNRGLEPDINQTADVTASDQAAEQSAVDLAYAWIGRRTDFNVAALYFNDKFTGNTNTANRSGFGGNVAGTMRLSPRLALSATLDWRRSAPETGTALIDSQARVGLIWKFSRLFDLTMDVQRFKRNGARLGFDETRFLAMLEWRVTRINGAHLRAPIDTPASRRINAKRP